MSAVSIQQMADRVAELMEQRLHIKGAGLREKLRRGGRLLPRGIRNAAEALASAAEQAQNPRLLLQLDPEKVARSYDLAVKHLSGLGARARRVAALTNFAASLALIALAVFALVVGVLYWRGFLGN